MRSLGYTSCKFFAELNQVKSSASLALQFLILTAARTIEVTHSGWDEFDFTRNLWTVPAQRMKARREHRVPLSTGSLDVITKIKKNTTTNISSRDQTQTNLCLTTSWEK